MTKRDPIKKAPVSPDKLSRDKKAKIADLLWQMEHTLSREQRVLWDQIMNLVEERYNR